MEREWEPSLEEVRRAMEYRARRLSPLSVFLLCHRIGPFCPPAYLDGSTGPCRIRPYQLDTHEGRLGPQCMVV